MGILNGGINMYENDLNYQEIKDFMVTMNRKSDLVEVLHKTQELYGYIPKHIVTLIAKTLKMPIAEIYGVITFYSRFSLVPKGKYSISICMGTACYVKGGEAILQEFSKLLHIGPDETTDDLIFSLIETRCVGECAVAPVITVNDRVYENVTIEDVPRILADIGEEA